ncbi:MAG: methionyl-tRNA formyltransferase [Candidatus Omnitrophica bacterium]|nr:methionyl-tRNA formyltransferase [Candidatus Omnitrophota bacterium]
MNIVFLGSAKFAVLPLKLLLGTHHDISCVVTQPDRRKGRGLSIAATPVKTLALEAGLKLYQPRDINAPESIKTLKGLEPDLLVVIAYGQILSQAALNIPRIFSVNLHASLLPKYRGAAPINWAVIKGEPVSGVTVIKMSPRMDAGPMIMQDKADIGGTDTSVTLEEKLSDKGAHLILQSLKAIESGNYKLTPQDEKEVILAPKLKKQDGLIRWDEPAQDICNLIKGCIPWPGAFTYYDNKLLKIYKGRVARISGHYIPGEIVKVHKEGISVFTGKDGLLIEELQIEGKRRMQADEFIAGNKVKGGEILGKNKK